MYITFLTWLHVTHHHIKPQWYVWLWSWLIDQSNIKLEQIFMSGGHWDRTMKFWKRVLRKINFTLISNFIPHGIDLYRLNILNECLGGCVGGGGGLISLVMTRTHHDGATYIWQNFSMKADIYPFIRPSLCQANRRQSKTWQIKKILIFHSKPVSIHKDCDCCFLIPRV